MTRRLAIVGLLVVLVGAGVFFFLRRSHGASPVAPRPADSAAARAADAALAPPAPADASPADIGERTAQAAPPPEVAPSPAVEAPTTPHAPAPDLEARAWLELRVVDEQERPVEDAEARIVSLRREGDLGSAYGVRGDAPIGRTDAQGRVRLGYHVWTTLDGRTLQLDLVVSHADFVSFRDTSLALAPGEHVVVLRRGATVVVSAWIGTPDVLVQDVSIRCDRDSRLPSKSWQREPDGRLSTTRLAPGPHRVWLEHESERHGHCFSRIEAFALAENEWKELHVELVPALALRGELDRRVPRPIADGHVQLSLQAGGTGADEPALNRQFEAEVASDGSFAFERVPPGSGQVFALCRGWVSQRALDPVVLEEWSGIAEDADPAERAEILGQAREQALHQQRATVTADAAPLVILMEPTGSVRVAVTTTEGSPLSGAIVHASPNVCYEGVGCMMVPWREWHASADASGVATIEDLPPDASLWIGAAHTGFQMRKVDRENNVSVAVLPGEVAEAAIVLEPK